MASPAGGVGPGSARQNKSATKKGSGQQQGASRIAATAKAGGEEMPMVTTNQSEERQTQSSNPSRGSAADELDWLETFKKFDTDNDGLIPLRELKTKIQEAGQASGLSPSERERLFDGVDKNMDNMIDFSEFCFLMTRAKRMRLKNIVFRAAQMVLPRTMREEKFNYLKQYNCFPPPLFVLIMTIIEISIYVYYVVVDPKKTGVSISGPVPRDSPLIYDPCLRKEVWRYLTYMLIHIGIYHILFNSIIQLVLGIPLELVHKYWRVAIVYLLGVLAGSLASSVADPRVYLAGASGGVYALLAAHVAHLVVNWAEMEFAIIRLLSLVIFIGFDIAVALYNRYKPGGGQDSVSYSAHVGGFIIGLLMGIVVLRNFKLKEWERIVWWIALVGSILLFILCVCWNIFYPQYCDSIWKPMTSHYTIGGTGTVAVQNTSNG